MRLRSMPRRRCRSHLGFALPALGVAVQFRHGSIDLHLVQKVAVFMGGDLAASVGDGSQVCRSVDHGAGRW